MQVAAKLKNAHFAAEVGSSPLGCKAVGLTLNTLSSRRRKARTWFYKVLSSAIANAEKTTSADIDG